MLMSDGTVVKVDQEPRRQWKDECSRAKLILLQMKRIVLLYELLRFDEMRVARQR